MKTSLSATGVMLLVLMVSFPAFSANLQEVRYERGYGGCGWGPSSDRGGAQMMGPGYGRSMHGGHWGMRGGAVGMEHDWGYGPHHWKSMEPEQREEWQKIRSKYQMETLELRKEIASKQIELQTLWNQPDVNQEKVEKLSEEVADLQAELGKKRDKYLLKCRRQFGGHGWACPGGW